MSQLEFTTAAQWHNVRLDKLSQTEEKVVTGEHQTLFAKEMHSKYILSLSVHSGCENRLDFNWRLNVT